jgi:voltage-gated potassium channel
MTDDADAGELKGTGYEIFIAALSVLSIVNLLLLYVIDDPTLNTVLLAMNGLLSIIFLADFAYRLLTAPSRSRYFFREFGWADLLASVPVQQVKILRIFRLLRVARLLRAYGTRRIGRMLLKDRAGSALYTLLLLGILVLQFGSLGMLRLEQDAADSNITTASDAIWYVLVTISTVGYGDRFPVTNSGRLLGAFIIVVGVGIFGTFTGYLANFFLAPREAKSAATPAPEGAEAQRLERLRELVARQHVTMDEIDEVLRSGAA